MEKVKLTREQAEAIEKLKKMAVSDDVIVHNTVFYQVTEKERDTAYKPFKDIDLDTLIKALYIGYEVEESFEVGEWVVHENVGSGVRDIITKITRVENKDKLYGMWTYIDDGEPLAHRETHSIAERCRHATPEEIAEEKQRRWWAKHGRGVWELKENDLLYYDDEFKEVEEVSEFGAIMLSSERVYFPIKTINSEFSVACFAEDRKDVK